MDQKNRNNSQPNQYKTLIVHGEKYLTTYTKKYAKRKAWKKPNEKHLTSFIPGTIKEVYVKEGDTLQKGTVLLTLEAMKMLNSISMPMAGKIKKIHVKKGDIIPKGTLMIEVE